MQRDKPMGLYNLVTRALYILASVFLTLISVAMIVSAGHRIWADFVAGEAIETALLHGIGMIVVSLAVFDVAKYLMEEEVLRDRELRLIGEARQTLTKFVVIITIAVSLEALIFILSAGRYDVQLVIYPAALLGVAALLVAALGLYMWLSSSAESRVDNEKD